MDKLEKLRENLNNLVISKSNNKEIINLSKRLDKEIIKFIKNEEKLNGKRWVKWISKLNTLKKNLLQCIIDLLLYMTGGFLCN